MDRTDTFTAACSALRELAPRAAELIRGKDLQVPAHGEGGWTAREVAVHLGIGPSLYADIATGVPSPLRTAKPADVPVVVEALHAAVPEADPDKLAALVLDGVDRFLDSTAGLPPDRVAPWHFGVDLDVTALACVLVSEFCLHGYDIATAVGVPWPIDAGHALIALGAMAPLLELVLSDSGRGHTACYGLSLRGGPAFTVRFTEGRITLEEPGGQVDCMISADPVAFLLTFSNRMPRWPAFTLGLITATGPRPELAAGFGDLFVFP